MARHRHTTTEATETTNSEAPTGLYGKALQATNTVYQTVTQTAAPVTNSVSETVRAARDFAATQANATVEYAKGVAPTPVVQYTEQAINTAASVRDQTLEKVRQTQSLVGSRATATRDFAASKASATRDYATGTVGATYDYTKQTAANIYDYSWNTGTSVAKTARSTAQTYLPEKVYSTLENTVVYSVDTAGNAAAAARGTVASTYEGIATTQQQARNYAYDTLTSLGNTADSYRSLAANYGGAAKERSLNVFSGLFGGQSTPAS